MKTWEEIKKEDKISKKIEKIKEWKEKKDQLIIDKAEKMKEVKGIVKKINYLNSNICIYQSQIKE